FVFSGRGHTSAAIGSLACQSPCPSRDLVIVRGADGRGLYVNNTDHSPARSNRLLCIAQHSRAIQSSLFP
ncbi:unnamed protein product, partial [Staurois parvus]